MLLSEWPHVFLQLVGFWAILASHPWRKEKESNLIRICKSNLISNNYTILLRDSHGKLHFNQGKMKMIGWQVYCQGFFVDHVFAAVVMLSWQLACSRVFCSLFHIILSSGIKIIGCRDSHFGYTLYSSLSSYLICTLRKELLVIL